jgi:hypothetical protein
MKRFVEGTDRKQSTLFPECLNDWIDENNPVQAIDAFVETLDLAELGFEGVEPAETGGSTRIRRPCVPRALDRSARLGYLQTVRAMDIAGHRVRAKTFDVPVQDAVFCRDGSFSCRGRHRLHGACSCELGSLQIRPGNHLVCDLRPVPLYLSMAGIVVSARASGRVSGNCGISRGSATRTVTKSARVEPASVV